MRLIFNLLRRPLFFALALAGTLATTAAQAQTAAELPDYPNVETVETVGAYCRTLLNDRRSVLPLNDNRDTPTYFYRRLRQVEKMPLTFTWDPAAVQLFIDRKLGMWGSINGTCEELVSDLGSRYGAALRPKLAKVKAIHFTTTNKKRPEHGDADDPASHGYFCSWNPATGVLTAAISQPDGPNSTTADSAFGAWIIKNVK